MTGPEGIDLEVGSGRWLPVWPALFGILGLVIVVTSAAAPGWKVVWLGAFSLACTVCIGGGRRADTVTRLRLRVDGSATLMTAIGARPAMLAEGGWCSRWCCVVPLTDTLAGPGYRCLVCRSRNSADAYRQLLLHLRLNGNATDRHGMRLA